MCHWSFSISSQRVRMIHLPQFFGLIIFKNRLLLKNNLTGEFLTQMASNAENVFIWWRHHDYCTMLYCKDEKKLYELTWDTSISIQIQLCIASVILNSEEFLNSFLGVSMVQWVSMCAKVWDMGIKIDKGSLTSSGWFYINVIQTHRSCIIFTQNINILETYFQQFVKHILCYKWIY